jgi:hypothetical protein
MGFLEYIFEGWKEAQRHRLGKAISGVTVLAAIILLWRLLPDQWLAALGILVLAGLVEIAIVGFVTLIWLASGE